MDIVDEIQGYLMNGGLFNPELMEHQKVSEMIIQARNEITALRAKVAELENQNGWINISYDSPEFELFSGEPLKVLGGDIPPLYKSERILYVCDGIVFTGKLDKLNETVMPKGTTHWMPLPKPPKD